MEPRNRRNVAAGALTVALVAVAVLLTIGQDNLVVWLLGVPAGVVVGALSHEYAPVVRDAMAAGVFGSATVGLLITAHGFYQSLTMGFGLDSWVSFGGAAKGLWALVVVGPAIAVECVLAAAVVHEIRIRRIARARSEN